MTTGASDGVSLSAAAAGGASVSLSALSRSFGQVRALDGLSLDIAPGELAGYCLHALTAAGGLSSEAAVRRLLAVTMSGLRPQPAS